MSRLAALAGPLVLSACVATSPDQRGSLPSTRGLTLVPAAQGFDIAPSGQEIGFGRFEPGAVRAAERVIGRAPERVERLGDCTRYRWRDGLTMDFRGAAFVGWTSADGRSAGRPCAQSA